MADQRDLIQALRPVVSGLDHLGVRYYVGGSVASSIHGAGRSTLDVDLAAELNETTAASLVSALQTEYYGSESAARDAVRRRSCFNLLHLETSFKIDIFVSRGRDFDLQIQQRATFHKLSDADPLKARIASPEDILLLKLEWYRLGNEVSERQWNDVLRVAQLQGNLLDRDYLRHWAAKLQVSDLAARLLAEIDTPRA